MSRITLRQLAIFCEVALHGSTAAASRSLALSQSATSSGLGELERSLRSALFDRIGKRLRLNGQGELLLPRALALLDEAQQIEQSAGAAAGDVKVFASTTIGNYLAPALLASYLKRHPAVRWNLAIGNTREAFAAVMDYSVDLALVEGPLSAEDLVVTPWLEDTLVVVAAPGCKLARKSSRRPVPLSDLKDARWLLREAGSGTRDAVEQALLPHLLSFGSRRVLGSSEAIKHAAAAGLGISCLSRWVVEDFIKQRRLVVLRTALPPLKRRLALIWHRRKHMSPGLREFIQHCRSFEAARG